LPGNGKGLAVRAVAAILAIRRRQVVIPRKVFDALGLAEGDFVEVTVENGRVDMKPRYAGDNLTAAEAKKVRHAVQQIKAGKTKPWSQVKHGLGL
jgi:AbrB family looped-hinge helix DNA binding protein